MAVARIGEKPRCTVHQSASPVSNFRSWSPTGTMSSGTAMPIFLVPAYPHNEIYGLSPYILWKISHCGIRGQAVRFTLPLRFPVGIHYSLGGAIQRAGGHSQAELAEIG